ncbi:twin-arginine translocase TatA/TatE family subunit [Altererythrobacter salegens]|uniref:Sec-independent protein translocase protein TatA n=1 Tax=Croceibacterium salegens TaxID=1737568 RepID=A0A6I4SYF5_9SPHN|nr:twin-arginine translocase TatA/TatE family subunit [Croceibacterium salegens]MXO61075.1 twin-arginine translocase TatA/TatE family subunit [Croceibacterium salegens]
MGSFSVWHWLVVGIVVLVLFGRGKLSETMGDFGKGVREFKKGMKESDEDRERELASRHPDIAPPSKVTIEQGESKSSGEN